VENEVMKFDTKEEQHCWTVFRSIARLSDFESVESCDSSEITLTQWTTVDPLPRWTVSANVEKTTTVTISLHKYSRMVVRNFTDLMERTALDFERIFPGRVLRSRFGGRGREDIETDLKRIPLLLNGVIMGEDSVVAFLRLLVKKDGKIHAVKMATELRAAFERLMRIWHRGIDYLQSADHFMDYNKIRDFIEEFLKEFGLDPMDCKAYEGRKDPLASHPGYM
jgi:hypothetical protein